MRVLTWLDEWAAQLVVLKACERVEMMDGVLVELMVVGMAFE